MNNINILLTQTRVACDERLLKHLWLKTDFSSSSLSL